MSLNFLLIWIGAVSVFSIFYLLRGKFVNRILNVKIHPVSAKAAKESLEKIASWTTWITSIQVAAIGSMAFLLKNNSENCVDPILSIQKTFAFFAILFFGSSIILSAWILSSIPSIILRLPDDDKSVSIKNDIYEIKIYSFVPFKFGPFTGLVHWYFLVGIIFFSLFIYSFIQ